MSSEDDLFLNAYLDGQLDADQRYLADSALASSPELAERLRALSAVRDLVVGLGREPGVDIAPRVMKRIRVLRRSRSSFSPLRLWAPSARQASALAGILTVAAGALLAVTVTSYHGQPRALRSGPSNSDSIDNRIAVSRSGASSAADDESARTVALEPWSSSTSAGVTHGVAFNTRESQIDRDVAPGNLDGQPAPGDLDLASGLLDSSYKRRFFLVKNGRDGKGPQQVASVVEHTTRHAFLKITISQGIVIDPRHPEEATVFALLVDNKELDRLRDRLKVALPDLIEESSADPAIVTQLADIGQVQKLSPVALADVSISNEAMAFQTRVSGGTDSEALTALAGVPKASSPPTAEQFRSAPLPTPARAGSAAEPEHATDLASADEVSRMADAPATGVAHASGPISGAEVAVPRPESAAHAAAVATSDEMTLVFVWICKPRAS